MGNNKVVSIHQDVRLFSAKPKKDQKISYDFLDGRYGFLQLARGEISIDGEVIKQGDGVEISAEKKIEITASADSEILLFDLG